MKIESKIFEPKLLENLDFYDLSSSHRKIFWEIENNPETFINMTTTELAKVLNISQSTISRFAKNFHFNNFTQLQIYVSKRIQYLKDKTFEIKETKKMSLKATMNNIKSHYVSAIEKTIEKLNSQEELNNYISTLFEYRGLNIIFGIGESALVANYFANNIRKLGFNAIFINEIHTFFSFSNLLKTKMHVTLISKTMDTLEIKAILRYLEQNEVAYSIWTKNENFKNTKAKNKILIESIEQNYRISAMGSKISFFLVADIAFSYLTNKIDKEKIIFKDIEKPIQEWNNLIKK
ncbi:MurR/RpiR family transcriptional regulator [Mycoplasma procyoni]|uniref:MurR/RpiR family transcriptional regulator n=1 Tax=Mycoplasma procyoni TaxID=568784 RepID=UPI00197CB333|nr:MurR/RpiR family transcriptional regulator [Mycoplasma procyoni]MBN3534688.1 MurR/RpiR family transcriptional regulator [Mycoplasma procyoni]